MAKSDDYIDFKAYIGYLRKVTGTPRNPQKLRQAVLDQAVERTELQTAHLLLKRLVAAAAVIVLIVFSAASYAYLSVTPEPCEDQELWKEARVEGPRRSSAQRLYEAYRSSSEIREKFL